jgi:hypothetical protein
MAEICTLLFCINCDKLKEKKRAKFAASRGNYTMKKLKDIFYDLNDIMVALIIVAVAALTIVSNIDSILNYPASIAAEIQLPEEEVPTNYADNPPVNDPSDGDSVDDDPGTTTGVGINDHGTAGGGTSGNEGTGTTGEVVNYSVYINSGSTGAQIAEILIGVGLFQDRQQFLDAVAAAGAEGKLQAGNFIIPSDATPAEVISIITN